MSRRDQEGEPEADEIVAFEGREYECDRNFWDHEPGVRLLIMQWGSALYREYEDQESAVDAGDSASDQSGIPAYSPVAVVDPDGTVLHRW